MKNYLSPHYPFKLLSQNNIISTHEEDSKELSNFVYLEGVHNLPNRNSFPYYSLESC